MKPSQEQELEERFLVESKNIHEYQSQINELDKQIDEMVFDLYELTDEERRIVLDS